MCYTFSFLFSNISNKYPDLPNYCLCLFSFVVWCRSFVEQTQFNRSSPDRTLSNSFELQKFYNFFFKIRSWTKLVYRSIGPTRCCCRLDFCVDHLCAQIGGGDMVQQCALPKWNHFILRYSALWPKGIGHEKDTVYVESPAALHS